MKNIVKKSPFFFFSSILLEANEQKASITSPYNIMILGQREIRTTMGMKKLRKVQESVESERERKKTYTARGVPKRSPI